jgi:hypothetical protein
MRAAKPVRRRLTPDASPAHYRAAWIPATRQIAIPSSATRRRPDVGYTLAISSILRSAGKRIP